ncbi:hydrogenase/urease maturation nickel metallochaperone HypA [Patescibacteria group bacterium]
MHDIHAADKVLKMALEGAKKNNLQNIKKIMVDLGTVIEHGAEIDPSNLQYNVKMLARNTVAEGADIIVNKTTGSEVVLKEIEGDSVGD